MNRIVSAYAFSSILLFSFASLPIGAGNQQPGTPTITVDVKSPQKGTSAKFKATIDPKDNVMGIMRYYLLHNNGGFVRTDGKQMNVATEWESTVDNVPNGLYSIVVKQAYGNKNIVTSRAVRVEMSNVPVRDYGKVVCHTPTIHGNTVKCKADYTAPANRRDKIGLATFYLMPAPSGANMKDGPSSTETATTAEKTFDNVPAGTYWLFCIVDVSDQNGALVPGGGVCSKTVTVTVAP